jgi:hypothetical protein
VAVRVQKTLTVPAGATALEAAYEVDNVGAAAVVADFAVETCWGTTGPDALVAPVFASGGGTPPPGQTSRVGEARQFDGVGGFALADARWLLTAAVGASAAGAPRLWVAPIEVVSASEAGFERTFQGVSLIVVWPLRLNAGARWTARLSFSIDESGRASGQ